MVWTLISDVRRETENGLSLSQLTVVSGWVVVRFHVREVSLKLENME